MANRKAPFSQADVTRAQKATMAAGLPASRTEIMPDGRIVIYHDVPVSDDHLTPYEKWKAEKNARAAQGH